MKNLLVRLVQDDQGQDLIEYALLAGFISLAAVVGIQATGTALNGMYNNLGTNVNNAAAS